MGKKAIRLEHEYLGADDRAGPNYTKIETCKGWLQESAYQDYCLKVEDGWVRGKRGVVIFRFKEGESL